MHVHAYSVLCWNDNSDRSRYPPEGNKHVGTHKSKLVPKPMLAKCDTLRVGRATKVKPTGVHDLHRQPATSDLEREDWLVNAPQMVCLRHRPH